MVTLEPPRGWLATMSHFGPGLIISAAIVGSGELIVTPKVGAASGFTLLFPQPVVSGADRRARPEPDPAVPGGRSPVFHTTALLAS